MESSLSISKTIKLGLGFWFCCSEDSKLRHLHQETFEVISEVNIENSLYSLRRDGECMFASAKFTQIYGIRICYFTYSYLS